MIKAILVILAGFSALWGIFELDKDILEGRPLRKKTKRKMIKKRTDDDE